MQSISLRIPRLGSCRSVQGHRPLQATRHDYIGPRVWPVQGAQSTLYHQQSLSASRQERWIARATPGDGGQPQQAEQQTDSDLAFVAKLVVLSLAGGAAIKYSSFTVLEPLAMHPNVVVALIAVLGTPLAYGAWLLTRK